MSLMTLVPFLLAVDIGHLPEGYLPQWDNPDPEYIYQLHKTFVVHKDPIQTTQYNATVSCYFNQPNSLYCLLNFVNVFTTVTRDNITVEVTDTQLPGSDWFQIKFNNHGIEEILVNKTTNRKDIIKDIASLFDIGDDLTNKVLLPRTTFVATEETVVGSCSTTYDISAEYEGYRGGQTYINKDLHFHIILSEITKHSSNWTNKNLRILIEKNRAHCSSSHLQNYFPEIEVDKYVHTMEMINDKFEISSLMNGRFPPNKYNPHGTPLFTEKMLLNLTDIAIIRFIDIYDHTENYKWINIR